MRSQYHSASATPTVDGTSRLRMDEVYNLMGLNMVAPDPLVKNESPYTINSRMFAREEGQNRVASHTRKGSTLFSVPVGQTLSTQNVGTVVGEYAFGKIDASTEWIMKEKFTAGATGALTRIDLELRKNSGSYGPVIVELYSSNSGIPGTLLAESSIASVSFTTSQAFLTAYFMDAPSVTSGVDYVVVWRLQDNGSGIYYANYTAGSTGAISTDLGTSWESPSRSFRYKTYVSTAAGIKGFTRRYPSNGANRTLFAMQGTVYSMTDAAALSAIDTTLNTNATKVRFEHIDDKTVWVTGLNNPRYTSDGSTVADLASAPANATHVIAHANRLLFVVDKVKVVFSDLYNFTSYPSINFFYVPNPKSSDPITGWCRFQNNLIVFTHETKHIVRGSDISTFQRDEAEGTHGAVSQEAIAVARDGIYFMGDDGQIYFWNGAKDDLISEKVQPELDAIDDKTSVRLHLYKNQLRVYYHKTPDTQNNRMLLYDITYKQWFMDTGRSVVGSLEWTQDENQLIEFSSKTGWVFNGEIGYNDVGKALDYKYWTPYKIYGSGSSKKRIRGFRPIVRLSPTSADYTLSVGKDIDFLNSPDMRDYVVASGGKKWGSFVWGDGAVWGGKKFVDERAGMSGRGRHIQYRFERKGVDTPVELYGYAAQVKEGQPK